MTRNRTNILGAVCALVYIVVYLVLPFYAVYTVGVTGMQLISYNALLLFPLALGAAMCAAALLPSPVISLCTCAASAVATLVLMLCGRAVMTSNAVVSSSMSWLAAQSGGMDLTVLVYVTAGVGSIVCLLLCLAGVIIEAVYLMNDRRTATDTNAWHFKNNSSPNVPSGFNTFNGTPGGGFGARGGFNPGSSSKNGGLGPRSGNGGGFRPR